MNAHWRSCRVWQLRDSFNVLVPFGKLTKLSLVSSPSRTYESGNNEELPIFFSLQAADRDPQSACVFLTKQLTSAVCSGGRGRQTAATIQRPSNQRTAQLQGEAEPSEQGHRGVSDPFKVRSVLGQRPETSCWLSTWWRPRYPEPCRAETSECSSKKTCSVSLHVWQIIFYNIQTQLRCFLRL